MALTRQQALLVVPLRGTVMSIRWAWRSGPWVWSCGAKTTISAKTSSGLTAPTICTRRWPGSSNYASRITHLTTTSPVMKWTTSW